MEILKLNCSNFIHIKNHKSFRAGVKVATKPLHFLLTVHCYALHKIFISLAWFSMKFKKGLFDLEYEVLIQILVNPPSTLRGR